MSEKELLEKINQLEKRVAELEKNVSEIQEDIYEFVEEPEDSACAGHCSCCSVKNNTNQTSVSSLE